MSKLDCVPDIYDQSDFYNCTEWVFSNADNMDETKAFEILQEHNCLPLEAL